MNGIPEEAPCEGLTPRDTRGDPVLWWERETGWLRRETVTPKMDVFGHLGEYLLHLWMYVQGSLTWLLVAPPIIVPGPVTLKRLMIPAEIGEQSLESKHLLWGMLKFFPSVV